MGRKHPAKELITRYARTIFEWAGCATQRPGGIPTPCCEDNLPQTLYLSVGSLILEVPMLRRFVWQAVYGDNTSDLGVSITFQCIDGNWQARLALGCAGAGDPTVSCSTVPVSQTMVVVINALAGLEIPPRTASITVTYGGGSWTGSGTDNYGLGWTATVACSGGNWTVHVSAGSCDFGTQTFGASDPQGAGTPFLTGNGGFIACPAVPGGNLGASYNVYADVGSSGGASSEDVWTHASPEFTGVDCGPPLTFGWVGIVSDCLTGGTGSVLVTSAAGPVETGTGTGTAVPRRAMALDLNETLSGRATYVMAECFNVVTPPNESDLGSEQAVYETGTGTTPRYVFLNNWKSVGRALGERTRPVGYVTGHLTGTGTGTSSVGILTREAWFRTCCEDNEFSPGTGTGTDLIETGTGTFGLGPAPPNVLVPCCPAITGTGPYNGPFEMPGRLYVTFYRDASKSWKESCRIFNDVWSCVVDYTNVWPYNARPECLHWVGWTRDRRGHRVRVTIEACCFIGGSFNYWSVRADVFKYDQFGQSNGCALDTPFPWDSAACRYRKFICRRPVYEVIGMCPTGSFVGSPCPSGAGYPTPFCPTTGISPPHPEWPGYSLSLIDTSLSHPPAGPGYCCEPVGPFTPDPGGESLGQLFGVVIQE